MDKIKGQLAGVAALLGVIAAIGGGFVKYGEIVTKLDALESQEHSTVDTSGIESSIAVLEEKVNKLENADTSHSHEVGEHKHDEHSHTATLINKKEIELLKVQIEEIKVSTKNPLSN
jgi:demethoxyubiquinone hydroxylase (CLK1/Coq7/Cat5 family)